jgi:hypothetical protein
VVAISPGVWSPAASGSSHAHSTRLVSASSSATQHRPVQAADPHEVRAYREFLLHIVTVFEDSATELLGGDPAGRSMPLAAKQQLASLGAAEHAPVYFAADFPATGGEIPTVERRSKRPRSSSAKTATASTATMRSSARPSTSTTGGRRPHGLRACGVRTTRSASSPSPATSTACRGISTSRWLPTSGRRHHQRPLRQHAEAASQSSRKWLTPRGAYRLGKAAVTASRLPCGHGHRLR